ncbi:MAG TPA: DNA polymerase III subunit gamma/tau [Dehalococcoidales bacterium]
MASQVFYRKWRPQTIADLVGQPHVTQTLLNALKNGNISHAYLFCGPRGTGKTSTARILAKAVNCLTNNGRGEPCNTCAMCLAVMEDRAMDVIEIDAASNRGIDDIRDLREKVNYAPSQARRKVYIIDEFHMLSKDASNALLKTLEEPPPHVIFVLATTESHKVLPTILSRCQHFDFHRLNRSDVAAQLSKVCAGEKITIEPQSLQLIARSTTGSLRDALNLLEQLTTYYGPEIKFEQLQTMLGITGDARAKEIVKHIMDRDLSAGMAALNSVNRDGLDLRQFNRELVEYLRGLLLVKTGAVDAVDLTVEDIGELKEIANKAALPQILNAVKLFGQIDIGNNDNSTLPLELALVDCYLAQENKTNPVVRPAAPLPQPVTTAPPVYKPASAKTETKTTTAPPAATTPVATEPLAKPKADASGQARETPAQFTPPAKDPAPAAHSLSSEIERLKLNWKQVIDGADPSLKKTTASALLKSGCKPVSIEGATVVLAFGFPIHKENFEKPENKQVAEKIISGYLGRACKIECILDPKKDHLTNYAKKMGAQVVGTEEK